jgi:D-alanyl-D-alanine carboxypeptidase
VPFLQKSLVSLACVLASTAGAVVAGELLDSHAARAEALLLVEVDSGKVLLGENATYPWYPASVTKLMTTYVTLKALRDHRINLDTVFTVSTNAVAQQPSKMGFKLGTQVTVDNALKMLLVHSANDMAVVLAEGVSGSIDKFSDEMNAAAKRLGMTQTSYVNPNGLPADEQITSARDLAILARALIREFPEYDYFWHIPSIRLGKRIYGNTNHLIDSYQGADGMKTGFICASGFNLVATATRGDKRLIAVVLGASSSSARTSKAAQLLERGFTSSSPLSWLMPSLGTVDALVPVAASPPNLREDICGKNHKHPASDDSDEEPVAGSSPDDPGGQRSFFLSSLHNTTPKGSALLTSGLTASIPPVDVYIGPARAPGAIVTAPGPRKKPDTAVAAKPPGEKHAAKPAAAAANPSAANGLKPWPGGDNGSPPSSSEAKPEAKTDAKPDAKAKHAAAAKPKPPPPAPKAEAQ